MASAGEGEGEDNGGVKVKTEPETKPFELEDFIPLDAEDSSAANAADKVQKARTSKGSERAGKKAAADSAEQKKPAEKKKPAEQKKPADQKKSKSQKKEGKALLLRARDFTCQECMQEDAHQFIGDEHYCLRCIVKGSKNKGNKRMRLEKTIHIQLSELPDWPDVGSGSADVVGVLRQAIMRSTEHQDNGWVGLSFVGTAVRELVPDFDRVMKDFGDKSLGGLLDRLGTFQQRNTKTVRYVRNQSIS